MTLNVFQFEDYRELLKALIAQRQREGKVFSYRWFSKQAGFRSPNFLKLVIDGQRNLSDQSVEKCIQTFKLHGAEAQYFRAIVQINQTKSLQFRTQLAETILKLKGFEKAHPLFESQYRYYSEWYHIAIREMIASGSFNECPQWIAENLVPKISVKQVEVALKTLEKLELIRRNENGKYEVRHQSVGASHPLVKSSIVAFHQRMIGLAQESLQRHATEEREISCVSLALDESQLAHVRNLVFQLRQEILKVTSTKSETSRVYQVNFQVFPLTKTLSKNETQEPT